MCHGINRSMRPSPSSRQSQGGPAGRVEKEEGEEEEGEVKRKEKREEEENEEGREEEGEGRVAKEGRDGYG
ncbi:hypothetical protein Pcinc_043385 [Petrolisthes cinctipes]|uniref:Uncharacterized protein n=1 Tax=Petrolisthes cinctipes TaxID=88211 RepID=A0AAE1BGL9_PETCI|nr:hypothetical protein Pcinc_043385 [Petrolisthes cinctipes]